MLTVCISSCYFRRGLLSNLRWFSVAQQLILLLIGVGRCHESVMQTVKFLYHTRLVRMWAGKVVLMYTIGQLFSFAELTGCLCWYASIFVSFFLVSRWITALLNRLCNATRMANSFFIQWNVNDFSTPHANGALTFFRRYWSRSMLHAPAGWIQHGCYSTHKRWLILRV